MLLTMNLSESETKAYARIRDAVRTDALKRAYKLGRRFAQIVGVDGRILDVLEA